MRLFASLVLVLWTASLVPGAPASGSPSKPKYTGSWTLVPERSELKVAKPEAVAVEIQHPTPGEIQVVEKWKVGGQEMRREFRCSTLGKPCDYTEFSGQPSSMSIYYDGRKLIAVERHGKDSDVIVKRTYMLSEDTSELAVEVLQMVPPRAESDRLVFKPQ